MRHLKQSGSVWKRTGISTYDKYAGWYSVRDEAYYAEDETEERDGQRYAISTGTESNGLRKNLISSASQSTPINF